MNYPIYLKRKRTGTLILNVIMLVICLTATVVSFFTVGDWVFFLCATLFFILILAFNIWFTTEKTYVINEDSVASIAALLPKTTIPANDITGVTVNETKDTLKINYNTAEFDFERIAKDNASFASLGEGLWTMYISSRDVDKPLDEIMLLINKMRTEAASK